MNRAEVQQKYDHSLAHWLNRYRYMWKCGNVSQRNWSRASTQILTSWHTFLVFGIFQNPANFRITNDLGPYGKWFFHMGFFEVNKNSSRIVKIRFPMELHVCLPSGRSALVKVAVTSKVMEVSRMAQEQTSKRPAKSCWKLGFWIPAYVVSKVVLFAKLGKWFI